MTDFSRYGEAENQAWIDDEWPRAVDPERCNCYSLETLEYGPDYPCAADLLRLARLDKSA